MTVLRAGRVVLSGRTEDHAAEALAAAMVGQSAAESAPIAISAAWSGTPAIACRKLSLDREDGRGLAFRAEMLEVAPGEIVGVAGVEGSGQRELLRAVAGLHRPVGGSLETAQPVAFIPEDRTTEGLIGELTVAENMALGLGREAPWVRGGRLDWAAARASDCGAARYATTFAPPESWRQRRPSAAATSRNSSWPGRWRARHGCWSPRIRPAGSTCTPRAAIWAELRCCGLRWGGRPHVVERSRRGHRARDAGWW